MVIGGLWCEGGGGDNGEFGERSEVAGDREREGVPEEAREVMALIDPERRQGGTDGFEREQRFDHVEGDDCGTIRRHFDLP